MIKRGPKIVVFHANLKPLHHFIRHYMGKLKSGCPERREEGSSKFQGPRPASDPDPPPTPTESCESDETEVEEVKPFRTPPGLLVPVIGETKIRESMCGCQTDETGMAESSGPG